MKLFAVVAQSGAGKSTLIAAAVTAFPERLRIVRSVTTRKRRGPEDDPHYIFISSADMSQLQKSGELVQHAAYAGNEYGVTKSEITRVFSRGDGILALVEQSVFQYRDAGYKVVVIKLNAQGQSVFRDTSRLAADVARAKLSVEPAIVITNSFVDPDGLQKAKDKLISFLRDQLSD